MRAAHAGPGFGRIGPAAIARLMLQVHIGDARKVHALGHW